MTVKAWNWLPEGALSAPAVLGPIDEAVASWSRRWFPEARLRRQKLVFGNASSTHPAAASTPSLSLRASQAGLDILVGRVLDVDLARLELTEADRGVVDELCAEMMHDLAQALDAVLACPSANSLDDASGGVLIELSNDEGRRLLLIETSRAVLADARRKALPAPTARSGRLGALQSALGQAELAVSATLGSSVISLSEARRLAPGDVIVLDRGLDQPIDIVAGPDDVRLACARMVDAASPHSLRLETVASREN